VQTIDLERIARHRGSVFGAMAKEQPPQKLFESELWLAMSRLDPSRPIVVEAESSRVGDCVVPRRLWREMLAAPRVVLTADTEKRARYLTVAYADLVADAASLNDSIERLRPFHAKERIEEWLAMAAGKDFPTLAASLMREHYDPLYDRTRKRRSDEPMAKVRLSGFSDANLAAAASKLAIIVEKGAPASRGNVQADQRP
jgi:tRNA 2-selenouridine synthase